MTVGGAPRWDTFPRETLQRLQAAVDVDDVVDADVALPERTDLTCSAAQMRQCFALCVQYWTEGVARSKLLDLLDRLLRGDVLNAERRLEYKHIRERYKQLRFAQMLYGRRHRVHRLFGLTVSTMGSLQDAFRNDRRAAVIAYGIVLRGLLARPIWALARRSAERTRMDTAEGFLAYRDAEMQRLQRALQHEELTGPQFHAVRKIVSRQGSMYNALHTLEPCEEAYKMSRFLSAINGLMGARHDEMVAQAVSGQRRYRVPAPLPQDTRWRLDALVSRYRP